MWSLRIAKAKQTIICIQCSQTTKDNQNSIDGLDNYVISENSAFSVI